ncbi:MAG: hypothetical protein M1127_01190, partial [Patescibacteria group bacterium]|nr:hypothetical protein [Patescibacteria group bacterium]
MSAEKSADRGASEGAGREKQKSGHFSHWKKLFTKAPMTRRDFLKTARDWGILAAGVEVLNDGPKLKPRLKEEINEALFGDELEKSIEAKIKFIKSEYGIEVEMGPQAAGCINMRKGGEDIRGNELSPDRKNKVLDGLIEAMEVYPYWFLWQSINMIFAVGELLDKETEQGAFILGGKTLGEENIVLGFGVAGKNSAEKIRNFLRLGDDVKSLKGCFHHEFF